MPARTSSKRQSSRRVARTSPWLLAAVSAFFLWHTAAIAIAAIPLSVTDSMSIALRNTLRPLVLPYINMLAEWQDWRVFTFPDPLKYDRHFALDFVRRGRVIASDFLPPSDATIVERNNTDLGQKLAQGYCRKNNGTSEDEVRLTLRSYLDRDDPSMDLSVFDEPGASMKRTYEWYEYTYARVTCSSTPSS